MRKRVVLAYSGGLDTSAIIPWLIETHNAEVIAYCSDLGNSPEPKVIGEKAKRFGAVDFIFEDMKETFATEFIYPMVRAGATYQNEYLLGTAIARPLIAEGVARCAKSVKAQAVSHGATGKGNDQIRFERAWAYLVPTLEIIAPWKQWTLQGRHDLIAYLKTKGFEVDSKESRFSRDSNLFHNSTEGDVLEDPSQDFDAKDVYLWTTLPQNITATVTSVAIGFDQGVPVSLNGKTVKSYEILEELNKVGGRAGIGVLDLVEERTNGLKSRGIYETPGGTILHKALAALKQCNWSREMHELARYMGGKYGDFVYDGLWHSEARVAAESFFKGSSQVLTGEVVLKIVAGQMLIASRKSPFSLYQSAASSFEGDKFGINAASDGFSKTLRYKQLQAGLLVEKNHGHS